MIDRDAIVAAAEGEVRFDEPLRAHTTFRIGGPVDALAWPTGVGGVQRLCALAHARGWPCRALGHGSNLLVRDGGVRGLLVATTRLRRLERDRERGVRCEAGVPTSRLLHEATSWELGGVEFLVGVPGTVGGGLVMNAGTSLGELKDVTVEVTTVRPDGELRVRAAAACGFRYRGSDLGDGIVVAARFELRPGVRAAIVARIAAQREARARREPHGVPTAGSFFKNPPGDFAGRLLEQAGLKGRRLGGAEVSWVHANWIVNRADATAADVLGLMQVCQEAVATKFGVTLEPEVHIVGEAGREEAA
ncbi:MAG: UDP-N-acetylmuramate dehydrogenase [Deltaproteobacteria bacterium]|nr:UDP-N-acetylmuramate dehydrogenase [Deltaproteobacteria bacterium]